MCTSVQRTCEHWNAFALCTADSRHKKQHSLFFAFRKHEDFSLSLLLSLFQTLSSLSLSSTKYTTQGFFLLKSPPKQRVTQETDNHFLKISRHCVFFFLIPKYQWCAELKDIVTWKDWLVVWLRKPKKSLAELRKKQTETS